MKKIFFLLTLILSCLIVGAQSTTPRFGTKSNDDNTGRVLTYKYSHVNVSPGTATIYLKPNAWETIYQVDTLKHALTDSLSVSNAYLGDNVTFIFIADTLTAGRVVTFGNHMKCAGTLTVAKQKKATATFIFDGTIWTEKCRSVNTN